jgi:succinate dehydrogenase hydrophobic anchor subunit
MGASLPENPGMAFAKVQHELANPWILAVYVIAMIAVCWHFAYGVWLFAAKWGITPGETARRRFGYVCVAFGVILAGMGLASIWAFVGPKYQNAPDNVPLAYQVSGFRDQVSRTRDLGFGLKMQRGHLIVLAGEFDVHTSTVS